MSKWLTGSEVREIYQSSEEEIDPGLLALDVTTLLDDRERLLGLISELLDELYDGVGPEWPPLVEARACLAACSA